MSNKISAKTEYACVAIMELAVNQASSEPVRIRQIADRHSVPPRFLVQILLQLKSAGIVESTRGASGGYRLKRRPDEITLGEIMNVIEPMPINKRANPSTSSARSPATALNEVWDTAEVRRQEYLNNVTFADLIKMANLSPVKPTHIKSTAEEFAHASH